jgi:flagellar assembly protein FliH
MSCKILPQSGQLIAERVYWKEINSDRPPSSIRTQALTSVRDTDDLRKVHNRIAELESAMESQLRQAHARGLEEGMKAGRESASAELQPVMERLLRSCSEVAGMRARIRKETEGDIVTLTVAIARRVLRRELAVDPEAIHGVVKAALEKVQSKEICSIKTHPDHATQVRAFFEKAGLSAGIDIAADASLSPGGLVIETKRGNLDASVETQLKEIERGFTDRLGR